MHIYHCFYLFLFFPLKNIDGALAPNASFGKRGTDDSFDNVVIPRDNLVQVIEVTKDVLCTIDATEVYSFFF